jgi:hypothetical protein
MGHLPVALTAPILLTSSQIIAKMTAERGGDQLAAWVRLFFGSLEP